jgi:putative two-component system response regulator
MNSALKLFKFLDKKRPAIILLDVEMPEVDGFTALKQIKSGPFADIPVIMLTARSDIESEIIGFEHGAIDFVTKPFSIPRLLKRMETYISSSKDALKLAEYNRSLEDTVRERTKQLYELQSGILSVLADMVESRDEVTGGHIERTEYYLELLLNKMLEKGVYSEELKKYDLPVLIMSAQLHDIGKIAISDVILNKPGRLTDEEFNIIKRHTTIGEELINKIEDRTHAADFLENARLFAGYHHEKWNGTGYPYGLAEEKIPLHGRIMAIADVYDALVSERPYKKAFSHKDACDIILNGRGSHFDPVIVDVFSEISADESVWKPITLKGTV